LEAEPDEDPDSERQWLLLAVEFWLHAMRDERARLLMAEQYERARLASAELIAPLYQTLGQQPSMPPREMAIVIESIGIGLAIQAALDPGAVRMSLQGEVIARLLNLPALPDPVPAPPQAASDPSGQAGG
jgi:hypothetical protein